MQEILPSQRIHYCHHHAKEALLFLLIIIQVRTSSFGCECLPDIIVILWLSRTPNSQ
jgi:hypothetical protein